MGLVCSADRQITSTRRYHGLLHSGGRYVVSDPEAAREAVMKDIADAQSSTFGRLTVLPGRVGPKASAQGV